MCIVLKKKEYIQIYTNNITQTINKVKDKGSVIIYFPFPLKG